MGQGDSARDFDPSESMENAGILDVFPIFHAARLGQKIRRSPLLPLCGVALDYSVCIGPQWGQGNSVQIRSEPVTVTGSDALEVIGLSA